MNFVSVRRAVRYWKRCASGCLLACTVSLGAAWIFRQQGNPWAAYFAGLLATGLAVAAWKYYGAAKRIERLVFPGGN